MPLTTNADALGAATRIIVVYIKRLGKEGILLIYSVPGSNRCSSQFVRFMRIGTNGNKGKVRVRACGICMDYYADVYLVPTYNGFGIGNQSHVPPATRDKSRHVRHFMSVSA